MRRTILALAACTAGLFGCGGGGNPEDSAKNPSNEVRTPASVVVFDRTPPEDIVDPDTRSSIISLGAGSRAEPLTDALDVSVKSNASGYEVTFASGKFTGGSFFSDLNLQPASFNIYSTSRVLQGFSTTQFEGSIGLAGAHAYATSIQWLTESGMGSVGIGQWKYYGDYQPGYFSGLKSVRGAFLVGKSTPSSDVARVASGVYAGFSQAGVDAYYVDVNDQLTANASVDYDATAKTVTIRLSRFNYWNSYFGQNGRWSVTWSEPRSASYLPDSLSCSGTVSSAGLFSCRFESNLSGTLKGKFFGPGGQIIAGTFSLTGMAATFGTDGVAGGFITQRSTAATMPPAASPTWTLGVGRIEAQGYVAQWTGAKLQARVSVADTQAPNIAVIDKAGWINPNARLTKLDAQTYEVNLSARPSAQVGTRTGEVEIRLCQDDPLICAQPVAGSPWKRAYQIVDQKYPGPDPVFAPGALDAVAYAGQSLILTPRVSFSQPSVAWGGYSNMQYQYTVTDAGIFDVPYYSTGVWYNEMPSSFANSPRFDLKSDLEVGVYEGAVKLAICGYQAGKNDCLPVEHPVVEIPYKVTVKSWEDLRPLSIAPEISALVNKRGSPSERLTFPLVTDPQKISVRWKIPFSATVGKQMIGQGFFYNTAYQSNDQQRLDVYRESDGKLLWSRMFSTRSSDSLYGRSFTVDASNARLYVQSGDIGRQFVLQVFEPLTGRLVFEKDCGTQCVRYWDEVYDHGWVARTFDYSTRGLGLWIYDERTDTLITTPEHDSFSSELNATEIAKIREVFFSGVDASPTTPAASVSSQCGSQRSLSPSPALYRPSGQDACYVPALGIPTWSLPASTLPSWPAWPSSIDAMAAAGTVIYYADNTIFFRDSADGHELARMPGTSSYFMARTANLLFVGGERIEAIDIATRQVVWTLPYPGEVMAISNAGVLYVQIKLGSTVDYWHLVAINLR